jgi:2-C-methyl-D-erythritol 4-phosphate cytidylyltransferase
MQNSLPKQFMQLAGRIVVQWSLDCFAQLDPVDEIILVLPADRIEQGRALLAGFVADCPFSIVAGGARRQDSVMSGISAASEGWVMVHDAARPGITPEIVRAALHKADRCGNAVCAVPSTDTLVRAKNGCVDASLDRSEVFRLQTPQIFRRSELLAALAYAEANSLAITDESSIMAKLGHKIFLAEGSELNNKITCRHDLEVLEILLAEQIKQQQV